MPQSSLKTTLASFVVLSACALLAAEAQAEVKYRVGFDATALEYVVYMMPDSVPDPDLTLSAQVTLKVPSATGLDVNSIQSAIGGVEWQLHSRVLAPEEDASAAYLSFGPVFTAGTPPAFGWVAGEEKRIFSFKAEQGCLTGVALLANSDPFNQLPNSVSTNPGNQFTNIGWPSSNNYIGNYGHPVYCGTRPDERECRRSRGQVRSYDLRIQTLQNQIDKLERMRLQLEQMQDGLEGRKGYLIEQCDIE